MTHKFFEIPREVSDLIKRLGRNIRTARLRRGMHLSELAIKVGVTRKTMMEIEHGKPGSSLANYATSLWVLGLLDPLARVADPDTDQHGKVLESARLPQRARRRSVEGEKSYDF